MPAMPTMTISQISACENGVSRLNWLRRVKITPTTPSVIAVNDDDVAHRLPRMRARAKAVGQYGPTEIFGILAQSLRPNNARKRIPQRGTARRRDHPPM